MQFIVYFINQAPPILLGLDIPERAWKGRDPTYSDLRVLECKTFMHVPKEHKSKLDFKTNSCVFVSMAIKNITINPKKAVRSGDVVFFEQEKGNLPSTKYTSKFCLIFFL